MEHTASFDVLRDALDFAYWCEAREYKIVAVAQKDKGAEGLVYYEVSYTSK